MSPTGGGGQVGLLLISSYVKAGTVTPTDYFNHFSLLRSIEDIFGLDHLGYASNPALPTLDRSVFNASRPAQVPRPSVDRHAASHQPHQSLHYE